MKGVISQSHHSWLVSHVVRQSPTAVELKNVSGSLRAVCDDAVIAHIASEIDVSHEQATRIANLGLFVSYNTDANFEMPDGSFVGRLPTSFRCLGYSVTVKVGSDDAQRFLDLLSQYKHIVVDMRAVETEARNYFTNTCRTYTQLKKMHSALYASLLNAYGINDTTDNPLALSGTDRIAELINSLTGVSNGA